MNKYEEEGSYELLEVPNWIGIVIFLILFLILSYFPISAGIQQNLNLTMKFNESVDCFDNYNNKIMNSTCIREEVCTKYISLLGKCKNWEEGK